MLELGRGERPCRARPPAARARAQAAHPARRRALRRRAHLQLQAHPGPRRGLSGDPQGGSAPTTTSASPTGSSARRESGPASTRRSSGTTSSGPRPLPGGARARRTSEAGSWPPGPPLGSDPPGGAPWLAATSLPRSSLLERAVSLLPDDDPGQAGPHAEAGIALAETGQLTRADALLHDRIEAERRGRAFVVFHDPQRASGTCVGPRRRDAHDHRRPAGRTTTWRSPGTTRCRAATPSCSARWRAGCSSDDESRNGSYLNGERVTGRHALRDGDVLRFGDTVVLFRAPARMRSARPAVSPEPEQVTSMGQRPTHGAGRRPSGTPSRIMRGVPENLPPPLHPRVEGSRPRPSARAGRSSSTRTATTPQQLFSLEPGLTEASVGRQRSSDLVLELGRAGLAPPRPARAGRGGLDGRRRRPVAATARS